MLNQQLAYPAAIIEPFTDCTRDEGEPRLGLLRELFGRERGDKGEIRYAVFRAVLPLSREAACVPLSYRLC